MNSWISMMLEEDILCLRFFMDTFSGDLVCEPLSDTQRKDKNLVDFTKLGLIRVSNCHLGGCVHLTDFGEMCQARLLNGYMYVQIPVEEEES